MKKRIITILLAVSMIISMFSVGVSAASNEKPNYSKAVTSTSELSSRLNTLMNKYVGTYWTTNGKASDSSGTTSKYYHGIQCKGFASYIFNDLFCTGFIGSTNSAKYYITSPNGAKLVGKKNGYSANSSGAKTVKNVLSKAKVGDFVQVKRRSSGGPHSMIVAGVSDTGITLFDCNTDGKCGVKKYTQTWSTFASKNSGFSLYHSTKYPGGTSTKPVEDTSGTQYYPIPSKEYDSLVDALESIGVDSSYTHRSSIAVANSVSNYSGTASQNTKLRNLLYDGKLKKDDCCKSTTTKVTYFKKCGSGYTSLVDALNSIGAESSYNYRKKIASANSISNYSGSESQNTTMLNLLKKGTLIKP